MKYHKDFENSMWPLLTSIIAFTWDLAVEQAYWT